MTCETKSITAKKKAFTLIELLIVIAIIGILFIVLISKVNFATDKAKATGVQTDFRSFQVAIETVAKEKAGLSTFGWDIGDVNGDRVRNSYDKGDTNQNGKQDEGEVFIGSKTYGEEWVSVYTLTNPADANDMSAIVALEEAINQNLDPKLHITINNDLTITMSNGAQDPWKTEYHGYYITNAINDGKDRGAIVIYSNGANQEWGSEHSIANGVVTVNVPGNNVYGKDDYSLAVVFTYVNGYGEVKTTTSGFSNNQGGGQAGTNGTLTPGDQPGEDTPDDNNESPAFNLLAGMYEPGAIKVCEESGLEAAQDMMITPWNELVASGAIVVNNGIVSRGEAAPDNLPAVNEYGFYFDVVYYCSNQDAEFVFYADGAFEFYVGGELIASFPSGTAIYSSNLADLSSSGAPNAIFSDDMHMSFDGEEFSACQPAQFDGDLIFPADGSVSVIDTEAFLCMNLTGVLIPSTIVSINDFAFCETPLETVCFAPNSQLEYIGYASFADCWYLEDMVIPDNVKYIGDYAFAACESLLNVTINDGLEEMGYAPFYGCISLESITLPFTGLNKDGFSEEESYNNLFGYIFGSEYYDGSVEVVQTWYQLGKNITVYLPASLKTVTITGNKVQSFAFTGCTLENVIIGDKVEVIETAAFFDSYLTNVTIGSSLKATGAGAFMCSTQNVYVTNFAGWCSVDFGDFDGHPYTDFIYVNGELITNMVHLIIPDGVTHIGTRALSRCNNLTSITIPSSVTSIGSWPFYNSNITSVYISDLAAWCNIESDWSRSDSTKLYLNGSEVAGDIVLPEGIERIGNYALYGCDQITSIIIPSSVTTIGEKAFSYCTNITSVTIGNSVTSIGHEAFFKCYKLVEAINKSSLNIQKGEADNGYVACYALELHNRESKIDNKDGYLFYTYDGVNYLVNYIGKETELTLLENYNGENYVINRYTFYNNNNITSVTIPNSVTSIGERAFSGCTSLTKIALPFTGASADATGYESHFGYIFGYSYRSSSGSNYHYCDSSTKYYYTYNIPASLKKVVITGCIIGDEVFRNCSSITSITIPEGITSLGNYTFSGCTGLEEIYFNATAMNDLSYTSTFINAGKDGVGIKVVIGSNVTKIPANLFRPYSSFVPKIVSVEFEEGSVCESIGSYAFYDTDYLTSINLPASIETIGTYAFANCSSLTSITLPANLTTIEKYAFDSCAALTKIEFNAIAMDDLAYNNYVFYNVGRGGAGINVVIGANVTKIPACLFHPTTSAKYPPKIVSVEFEDGSVCESIGQGAFRECEQLTTVEFGTNSKLKSIGSGAFYTCISLTSIDIPASVTEIGTGAFGWNKTPNRNTSVYITDIAAWCNISFADMMSNPFDNGNLYLNGKLVTDLVIPASVTSIGDWTFPRCTSLTSVTIPDSVTSIGDRAFYGCSSLVSVTIPNSVTSIHNMAFYNCTSLTNIKVDINNTAYKDIDGNLYSKDGKTLIQYTLGKTQTSFTIPDGVTTIGEYAFYNCTRLESVTIGSSVTSINKYAFYECTGLKNIVITSSKVITFKTGAFKNVNLTAIYVNSDLVERYKTASGWRDFGDKIQAIPTI